MEKEIIVQLPSYNSGVTNRGVNKISNSEWEVSLSSPIIVNNGDTINVRNVYLDTRQTNSNAVIIEKDTVIELENYFYMMLPPDMYSDDLVTNTPDAWKYTVFGAAFNTIMPSKNELGISVIPPSLGYYNTGTPPTSGTPNNSSGTNQTLSFEIPMILRENYLDGGVPITKTWSYTLKAGTYQYDDLALILTRSMSQIPNPANATNIMSSTTGNAFICGELGKNYIDGNNTNPSTESYTTSYNGKQGVFSEFLSNINVPVSLLDPNYNGSGVSFENPFTIAAGGKLLLSPIGGTYANRTVFANQVVGATEISIVFNDQSSKFEFQYTHTPVQSAANVIEPVASNPPVGITTSAGAPIESVMLCGSINNINEQPLNQQEAASYDEDGNNPPNLTQGTLYQITQLGFIVDIPGGGNPNVNVDWSPIGGSETASVGDQFTMSDATGGFPQSIGPFQIYGCFVVAVNPSQPSLTENICRYTKHSGIMFKKMLPESFWSDVLGFNVKSLLVTDEELLNRTMTFRRFKNITTEGFMGQTDNFDFGYPTPIYPIKTPAPDFYSYLPLGKSSGVAADISVEQVLAMTAAVAVYSDTSVQPFFPFTFTSVATIPIEALNFAVGSKDTTGHSLLELTLGYNNQLINNQNSYQVKSIISNYYTPTAGGFSSAPFPDSYVYQHFGEPIQLSCIKLRVLDAITMTNLLGLGPNSCVYLTVTKQITDAEVNAVDS
jgi:hypothetical protein